MKTSNRHFSRVLLSPLILLLIFRVSILPASETTRAQLLTEITAYYASPADSLKRAAARFLIDNMEGHSYVTFDLVDTTDAVIPFDVLSFANYDSLGVGFGKLEDQHGVLDFKKREIIYDDSVITSDFLIAHIDQAFLAWGTRPWGRALSFKDFCEFVLPYRGSNEPLELWRPYFYSRYDSAFQHMKNPSDPIEAAALINQDLMSWFHFDPRFYYHPTDQSLSEMQSTTLGRCEDMTNLTIYAMRANGLAVTSDYTPYWANSGNNHAWNSILTPDGKVIPFMGAEANPGSYQLANKLAKVYRKTYSIQQENLAFQVPDIEKLPGYLASKSYTDVTRDYTKVKTLLLAIDAPDSVQFAYLCVFNSGEWKAIQWSRITNHIASFTDMGVDVAYLPATYADKKIIPAGMPFILSLDGKMETLNPDTIQKSTLQLTSTTVVKQVTSTDGFTKSNLTPGTTYELSYWNNGWQLVGSAVAGAEPLEFANVPTNCFYWLTAKDSDREERIFTYDKQTQKWW